MKKILVIDDDQTFRELVLASADKKKYEITSAADGVEGLEAVAKSAPDAILLDIKMPRMSGMEFLKKMNESQKGQRIPILITSNDASMETITRGAELGVRGYFVKSNESMKSIFEMVGRMFADQPSTHA